MILQEVTTMSDLPFQGLTVDVPRRFRSFYGRIVNQMPLLLADGRVPLTPKQLLQERVHGENAHDRKLLQDNYINTACAVITDSEGEVLVGLYSDPLVEELINSLNPGSRLQSGSLPVDADAYQQIKKNKAFVISPDEASNLCNSWYNEQRVRESFWDYIAEGNAQLVREYLRLVQEPRGRSMKKYMGLWVSSRPGLRLLFARAVDDLYAGLAGDDIHLGYDDGLLVGVVSAGGAQSTEGARERAAQKNNGPYREPSYPRRPSLEDVLGAAERYVAPACREDFQADMKKLYK